MAEQKIDPRIKTGHDIRNDIKEHVDVSPVQMGAKGGKVGGDLDDILNTLKKISPGAVTQAGRMQEMGQAEGWWGMPGEMGYRQDNYGYRGGGDPAWHNAPPLNEYRSHGVSQEVDKDGIPLYATAGTGDDGLFGDRAHNIQVDRSAPMPVDTSIMNEDTLFALLETWVHYCRLPPKRLVNEDIGAFIENLHRQTNGRIAVHPSHIPFILNEGGAPDDTALTAHQIDAILEDIVRNAVAYRTPLNEMNREGVPSRKYSRRGNGSNQMIQLFNSMTPGEQNAFIKEMVKSFGKEALQ